MRMLKRDVPYPAHPDFSSRVARLIRMSTIHFAAECPKILQRFMTPTSTVDWDRYLRENRDEILSTFEKFSNRVGVALPECSLPEYD